MPNSAADHAPVCDSYDPPPELSGLGDLVGSAIQENPAEGLTALKLNFSLAKAPGRAPPTVDGVEHDSVKTDGNKLTLRGLLHFSWEEAGFNRWSPAMEGKRSWYVVRKYPCCKRQKTKPRRACHSPLFCTCLSHSALSRRTRLNSAGLTGVLRRLRWTRGHDA